MKTPPDITVTSGVSSKTGEGFIIVRWGELAAQLTPDEARRHALGVIQAADAAVFDSALMRVFGGPEGYKDPVAGQVLVAIRNARGGEGHSFREQFSPEPIE